MCPVCDFLPQSRGTCVHVPALLACILCLCIADMTAHSMADLPHCKGSMYSDAFVCTGLQAGGICGHLPVHAACRLEGLAACASTVAGLLRCMGSMCSDAACWYCHLRSRGIRVHLPMHAACSAKWRLPIGTCMHLALIGLINRQHAPSSRPAEINHCYLHRAFAEQEHPAASALLDLAWCTWRPARLHCTGSVHVDVAARTHSESGASAWRAPVHVAYLLPIESFSICAHICHIIVYHAQEVMCHRRNELKQGGCAQRAHVRAHRLHVHRC